MQGEHYFLRIHSTVEPYKVIREFDLPGNSRCVEWHTDGERLIVGGNFDSIVECDLMSGAVKTLRKISSPANALWLATGSDCLVSAHDEGSIRFTGIGNSRSNALSVHNHPIRSMVISSDEKLGISVDDMGVVALWMVQPMQGLGTLFNANHIGDARVKVYSGLWLSPDDRELSLAHNSPVGPVIRTWSLAEKSAAQTLSTDD